MENDEYVKLVKERIESEVGR
jgi:hypothetical protein